MKQLKVVTAAAGDLSSTLNRWKARLKKVQFDDALKVLSEFKKWGFTDNLERGEYAQVVKTTKIGKNIGPFVGLVMGIDPIGEEGGLLDFLGHCEKKGLIQKSEASVAAATREVPLQFTAVSSGRVSAGFKKETAAPIKGQMKNKFKFESIGDIEKHKWAGNHASDHRALGAADVFIHDTNNSDLDRVKAIKIVCERAMGVGYPRLGGAALINWWIDEGNEQTLSSTILATAFEDMSKDEQKEYLKKHPNSKYGLGKKGNSRVPDSKKSAERKKVNDSQPDSKEKTKRKVDPKKQLQKNMAFESLLMGRIVRLKKILNGKEKGGPGLTKKRAAELLKKFEKQSKGVKQNNQRWEAELKKG